MTEDVPMDITGHERRERADGGTGVVADGTPTEEPAIEGPAEAGEEVEPVEVLVTLAEDGEIEPWDIDVVVVTDKFLERLDEADLRSSGRALFYASVLLRMKSDALLEDDEAEPEPETEPDPFAAPPGEATDDDPFDALEDEMDRRLERKRARGSPQTLEELVRELREAERDSWWKESREYDTDESPRGFRRGTQELDYHANDDLRADAEPTAADVTERTHGEDAEELRETIAARLGEHFEAGRDEVLFREVDDVADSRVQTFLGLLFLADEGRIELRQDEWFGDLWIRDPNAPAPIDPTAAD